jgi:hypothetical protein
MVSKPNPSSTNNVFEGLRRTKSSPSMATFSRLSVLKSNVTETAGAPFNAETLTGIFITEFTSETTAEVEVKAMKEFSGVNISGSFMSSQAENKITPARLNKIYFIIVFIINVSS